MISHDIKNYSCLDKMVKNFIFKRTNTNSNIPEVATWVDEFAQNSWGIAKNPASDSYWIANNGSGRLTNYNLEDGGSVGAPVRVPSGLLGPSLFGNPTGLLWNTTEAFKITKNTVTLESHLISVNESPGFIFGWNPNVDSENAIIATTPASKVYKGIALGLLNLNFFYNNNTTSKIRQKLIDAHVNLKSKDSKDTKDAKVMVISKNTKDMKVSIVTNGKDPKDVKVTLKKDKCHDIIIPLLFVANFSDAVVEQYDPFFNLIQTFTDPELVGLGYAPFNVFTFGNYLFVTFALQDVNNENDVPGPGNGFIDIFGLDGTFIKRFADGGVLNSPWGLEIDHNKGLLYVGNAGDGIINVFTLKHATWLGAIVDKINNPIVIERLWGLFGITKHNGYNWDPKFTLIFASGPNAEQDGIVGRLTPHKKCVIVVDFDCAKKYDKKCDKKCDKGCK